MRVYDDFAHHPTAMRATIGGLRHRLERDQLAHPGAAWRTPRILAVLRAAQQHDEARHDEARPAVGAGTGRPRLRAARPLGLERRRSPGAAGRASEGRRQRARPRGRSDRRCARRRPCARDEQRRLRRHPRQAARSARCSRAVAGARAEAAASRPSRCARSRSRRSARDRAARGAAPLHVPRKRPRRALAPPLLPLRGAPVGTIGAPLLHAKAWCATVVQPRKPGGPFCGSKGGQAEPGGGHGAEGPPGFLGPRKPSNAFLTANEAVTHPKPWPIRRLRLALRAPDALPFGLRRRSRPSSCGVRCPFTSRGSARTPLRTP
ncbi:MAG: hypothetical protein U1F67_06605 [Rubrivivax sp.]